MYPIIIMTETEAQRAAVLAVLTDAEEENRLPFTFNVRTEPNTEPEDGEAFTAEHCACGCNDWTTFDGLTACLNCRKPRTEDETPDPDDGQPDRRTSRY